MIQRLYDETTGVRCWKRIGSDCQQLNQLDL
jgi:hypothetical protein